MPVKTIVADGCWNQPEDELLAGLGSSLEGLSTIEAQTRLAAMGPNQVRSKRKVSPFGLFLNQFKSPIILILLLATGISAVLKDWVDALIILLIVLGSALLSFYQEYNASNAAEKLKDQVTFKTNVLRDGQPSLLPAEQVVPGDLILLSAGSLIPADGILIEGKDFFVNQAVLTGETFPVEKKPGVTPLQSSLAERTNMIFMGTSVRSGSGKALIVQTGAKTAFGQIAERLTLRPPETEFESGIRRLGYLLSQIMLVMVLAIFALNVIYDRPVLDSLLFSIALAVGLTPQLLPAIININLSRGSQAMAGCGVIVRRLESIENFGSMDVLCTDKTGTLTVGVVQLDAALDTDGQPSDTVLGYAALNARFETGLSNPMDDAIRAKAVPDMPGVEKVDEIPYDFVRKRLSIIVRQDGRMMMITKGAVENVLAACTSVQQGTDIRPLDDQIAAQIHDRFGKWSEDGYRVLGVAIKEYNQGDQALAGYRFDRQDESAMTLVGFLLFFDPPKEGVLETIQQLAALGVQLKIITGDNHLVAQHVAQTIGMDVTGVLRGPELDDMHDEALWNTAARTNLFAEVDPNQKERIILALKKTGHVVGYMGDGINDAPSLHSADVGISVNNAVDVAKEAADFVLLEQDLAVLKEGIVQGRKTFANTLKYVFMATSANFGNMFSMAGASLFLPFLPMLPKQILLINVLTDLPEMAIAGDNVDDVYIQRPHRWDIGFIRHFMLVFGPLSSLFDFLTFGALIWLIGPRQELFHTGWFIESVLSASLVVFAVRTRLPFWRSRPGRGMLVVTAIVGLFAVVLPYTPLAGWMGFVPLPPRYLLLIAVIIILYFFSAEVVKRWFYRRYSMKQ